MSVSNVVNPFMLWDPLRSNKSQAQVMQMIRTYCNQAAIDGSGQQDTLGN